MDIMGTSISEYLTDRLTKKWTLLPIVAETVSYKAFINQWNCSKDWLVLPCLFFSFFLPTYYLEFGSRTTLLLKKLYNFNLRLRLFCALLFLCQTNLALLSPWYPNYFRVRIYREQLKPFTFLVLKNWIRWMFTSPLIVMILFIFFYLPHLKCVKI